MPVKRLLLLVFLCLLLAALPTAAQTDTTLSLQTDTTDLRTGQQYEIAIRLDNIPEFWLANVEISYDSDLLYIIGTQAGSPVTVGSFFTPGSSLDVRNAVQGDTLLYAASQLAPADLLSGSGVLGTFRIYPLAPGTTTLTFRQAEIYTTTFEGEGADRVGTGAHPVDFAPVLLELTITGDPVEPPSEATATPTPSPVPEQQTGQSQPTQPPTLVNVTSVPTQEPTTPAASTQNDDSGDSDTSVLLIGIVVAALLLIAGVALILRARRR